MYFIGNNGLKQLSRSRGSQRSTHFVTYICKAVFVMLAIYLLFTIYYLSAMQSHASHHVYSSIENVILVLGLCLKEDGTATKLLQDRIAQSVALMNRYDFLSFDNTVYIVSGSDMSSFVFQDFTHLTEAEIMAELLINNHGVPVSSIIKENIARDTIENMFYSLKWIKKTNIKKLNSLFIVSSDFHMKRCLYILNVLNTNTEFHYNPNKYFIEIDKIYPIKAITKWESDEERNRKYEKENWFINNNTLHLMALCNNKKTLWGCCPLPPGSKPGPLINYKYDIYCNTLNKQLWKLN